MNPKVDNHNPEFHVDLVFPIGESLKLSIKEYAIKHHKVVKLVKNNKKRIRAKCKTGCAQTLYVAAIGDGLSYNVRTYDDLHTCGLSYTTQHLIVKWLGKKILNQFRGNPMWNVAGSK